jgi:hypothetical protein
MGEHRWRGYEHPELYKMINEGPGAQASEPQTTYWTNLSKELTEVDTDLNTKLNSLGSRWEGTAAESAQAGLTPLAAWAGDAETGSSVMKVSSEDQAQFVSDARSNMPEPVKVTTPAPSGWQYAAAAIGGIGPALAVAQQANDHEEQESAQNAAEQKAVQTMETYESSSTWNRDTLGTFVPPPDVVVSTPAPKGHATVTIITATAVNRVNSGDPDGSGTVHSGTNGGPSGTVNTPHVNTGDPGGGLTGGSGGGGGAGGGGGGTVLPPTVNNPGTTNPSDVFVPPVTGGGGGLPPMPTPNPLPPSPTPPGQNPFLPGGPNPFPSFGGGDSQFTNQLGQNNNAGDIARRAMPLRPGPTGLPGEGAPFGRNGLPGGGGLGALDGERVPSQLGRGGVLGGAPGEGGVVRSGPGAAGAAGRGGNGVNGPAAGGRRAEDEEDQEHYSPDYLLEDDDVFGDDRKVSPTVIGE